LLKKPFTFFSLAHLIYHLPAFSPRWKTMYFGEITTKLHKKFAILKKFMKKDLTN